MTAVSLYKFKDGSFEYVRGSLLSLPIELTSNNHREAYRRATPGWSKCPFGYDVYKFTCLDEQVVIPGIRLPESRKPKHVYPSHICSFDKKAITDFAQSILDEAGKAEAKSVELTSKLAHDLRKVSSQIVNFVEMLKTSLSDHQYGKAMVQAENLSASQQMLSLRLDMLDYTTGLAFEVPHEAIPVYKKFDKVVRMFTETAKVNDIDIRLIGPSNGYAMGPPVFELVPFVLIENAVKYSPRRGPINVKVTDFDERIDAHVKSFGPKISDNEIERVFEANFWGRHAEASGKSGSGIGLHAAKSLMTGSFNGTLRVVQERTPVSLDGAEVWGTTFSLSVPRVS